MQKYEDTININKNGREVQAKLTATDDDITLRIEEDVFIITKEDIS